MNKHMLSIYLLMIYLMIGCLFFIDKSAAAASSACELFTRADAQAIFNETVSEGISKKTTLPDGESCRYVFKKNGGTYGLTVKVSETAAIRTQGIFDSAADVMERQKKARKSSEHASSLFQSFPDLGDDAFWSGNDLWMRKGDTLLVITVHSVLEGSFKNRQAMDDAASKQNLTLSRQVAEIVLSRIK